MGIKSIGCALLFLYFLAPAQTFAATPANPNATLATLNLYQYIAALPERSTKRVISGQEAGSANPAYNIYSAAQAYPLYVTNLRNSTGILVGLAGFDYSADPNPSYKFPPITNSGVLQAVNINILEHWKQGAIVTVMFGANNPWTGGASGDINTSGHAITDAITPGTAAYLNWIAQLDAVAAALAQLQDAGVVVLWRPLHEMNGHWFWWGAPANPQDFKALWQHMFNYFTNTKKLNNLLWVYSASSGVTSAQNSVNTYYPGSNFVDIAALDGYRDTIDASIIAAYNSLLLNNKPFALSEYGPASPPAGTLSTTGNFDYSSLITGIRNNLPKTTYFMAWADCPTCSPKVHWSIGANKNAGLLLGDSWVINASDLAVDLQYLAYAAPGAPAIVGAAPGNAQAIVSFTGPANDGGLAIKGYTATCAAGGQTTRSGTAVGSVTSITVSGLTNGVAYACSVTATNPAGTSAPSGTASVTPAATFALGVSHSGTGYGNVTSSPGGISCYVAQPGVYYLIAPDCSESYSSGTQVTLSATAATGSIFLGWSGEGCAGVSNCTLDMSLQRNVTAVFNLSGMNFRAGWNLVGNGVEAPMAVASLFGDAAHVTSVWKYVPGTAKWAFYTPTQADGGWAYAASLGYEKLTAINAGEGFWVNAAASFSVPLPVGAAVQSSSFKPALPSLPAAGGAHALPAGWNLIAIGDNLTPAQFDAAIASGQSAAPGAGQVYTNLIALWHWDAAQQNWYFWAPSLVNSGELAGFLASKAYLDFATLPTNPAGTLSPSTGFWVKMP